MSVPTDSVLKRHHEQMMSRDGQASAPAASSPSSDSSSDSGSQGGGICGWLKRLFGG